MADREQVQGLLAEIGPLLDPLEITAFEDEGTWTVLVDEETLVIADYDAEQERLFLSADVGSPPEAARARTYELLLCYNNQWHETGGVRMALEEPGGEIVQIFDLPVHGLDATRLQAVVGNFVELLGAWRQVVSGGAPGDDAAASADPESAVDPSLMPGAIRV